MMSSGGFPDFLAYKPINNSYEIIGVESKINGYLDKEEREKCEWLLSKKIFGRILVASKVKNGRKVEVKYETF